MAPATATLGYPRIGSKRAMKMALESYWSGKTTEADLQASSDGVFAESINSQLEAGIEYIGVGDHTLYDQVLDWSFRFGCIPPRFKAALPADVSPLDLYFAMARGVPDAPALDMTKFVGTNYHYLVPELSAETKPEARFEDFLKIVTQGQKLGNGKASFSPIIIGPVTFIQLAKLAEDTTADQQLEKLLPLYLELLAKLQELNVAEIQLHEPVLVMSNAGDLRPLYEKVFKAIATSSAPPVHLVTYFDDVPASVLDWVLKLPGLSALSLDFTRGDNLSSLKSCAPFPSNVRLGAGVVDARSVWADYDTAPALLKKIVDTVGNTVSICVQPSASLMFVPLDINNEPDLPSELKQRLAFARQKLTTVVTVSKQITNDSTPHVDATANAQSVVATEIEELMFSRDQPFAERRPKQFSVAGGYGTTTIGSFPQTPEIRKLRHQRNKGTITTGQYNNAVDNQISYNIGIQEAIGLDVLVHGEPERTDMVEYFGEKLTGFAFTRNGWVQSYGSRYVRPPIIHSDVSRTEAMTVREFQVAQSMTTKPVKGMLTAATTIINWSFPRKDISREKQAYQIALALREEVLDLEAAGCKVIQVDDPALREGLPLKKENWDAYLRWAVRAFRLSTSGVKPETQIVTHLCYADFEDILEAIDDMNADVLTIENSRSSDDMLLALVRHGYSRDIGPGVYDIHSPVIPTLETMTTRVKLFTDCGLSPERIWVNPDCGLKTRKWREVLQSLKNMVDVANNERSI
eukprot:CFRG5362T1